MVIVAAVDNSDRATRVVNEGESLARAFDETLHVVHSLTRSAFVGLGRTAAENRESISMDDVKEVAAEVAAKAVPESDVPYETIGLVGDPADRIVDYATEVDARYIVVSGRKQSPAGKALFGSTSQSIFLHANCPVVSVVEQSAENG